MKLKGVFKYILIFAGILLAIIGTTSYFSEDKVKMKEAEEITANQFMKYVKNEKVSSIEIITTNTYETKLYKVELVDGEKVQLYRDANLFLADTKLFDKNDILYKENIEVVGQKSSNGIGSFITTMLIIFLGLFLLNKLLNRGKGGSGGANSTNPFTATKYEVIDLSKETSKYRVNLDSVIGLPKNTRKQIEDAASTITKVRDKKVVGDVNLTGLLLFGPPGTGKSMLAKAIASSVKGLFIHVSGSDFVRMFVGKGAQNIQGLFETARKVSKANGNAPVIIFIDEIDAIGKERTGGGTGGNDERESTLNQLLVELDGMEKTEPIFVIGATNFKESLDKALIRSGRLSTHIEIKAPSKEGRKDLFEFYFKKLPKEITLDEDIDLNVVAEYSVNMTGADISDIMEMIKMEANGTKSKLHFNLTDIIELIETKMYGTVNEELMNNQEVLESTAYHEAGHALVALKYFPSNVLKACITPRQNALGYVSHNIMDNRVALFKEDSKQYIELTLGGYIAEKLIYNDTSSGVSNDLEQANRVARNIIQRYGAGDTLLIKPDEQFKEGLSDVTMSKQEEEMVKILDSCRDNVEDFLSNNKDLLEKFTRLLLDKKVLNKNEIKEFYEEHKEYFVTQ